MTRFDSAIDRSFRVKPGRRLRLADHDPAWMNAKELRRLRKEELKVRAEAFLKVELNQLLAAQELLWANNAQSLLIVLQAMDAAGKDGTIKHVMSGVNPQGCRVVSFKQPTAHELDHNFLWRIGREVPERGQICIFNRSHYEDVLVVRVHPELLDLHGLPPGPVDKAFWQARYDDINAFERHLARNGTTIVKFFLNVSRDEQKRRLLERLDDPAKNWKFSAGDVAERKHWSAYMKAYEDAISATSKPWAPWYVVPADHKWITRAIVARVITRTITSLKLAPPRPTAAQRASLAGARTELLAEG